MNTPGKRTVSDVVLRKITFSETSSSIAQRQPTKIAILIPGIRTNADWIDETARHVETFEQPIRVIKAIGGTISAWHLVFRIGLSSIVQDIHNQITQVLIENPQAEISLICHSMGSDIASTIVDRIKYKFEYIIFLGSVCHTKYAVRIARSCQFFINHRGTHDPWPIIAAIVRPKTYSPTGTFGFNKGAYLNDISFNNDHATCTENDHVTEFVLPIIMGLKPEYTPNIIHAFSINTFRYVRAAIYISIFAGAILPFFFGWYTALIPVVVIACCAAFILVKGRSPAATTCRPAKDLQSSA